LKNNNEIKCHKKKAFGTNYMNFGKKEMTKVENKIFIGT
jgi:hypothetical protein